MGEGGAGVVGRCRGRVPSLLAQMGAAPTPGSAAARPPLTGRRRRPRAHCLPAALAVAALGGLGVLWMASGQGAIHRPAGWYSAGTRPGAAAVLGEPARYSTLAEQGGGAEEEGEGGDSPAEEVASYGGTDAGADMEAPERGRKENKKTVANWFHRTRKRKKGSRVHRVLTQVNLHYTSGSSLLSKQQARSFERGPGVSPVRCRERKGKNLTRADKYCRMVKQATRFVSTDRVLDLLPDGDAAEGGNRRYGSCALVGNSGVLLQKDLGEQIDRHDQVFRFNLAPTEGYEKHVGSWSSHEILNPENIRKIVAEPDKLAMLQRQGSKITALTFDDYLQFTAKLLMKKKRRSSSDMTSRGMNSQLLVEKHMEALADFHEAAPDVRIEYISPEFLAWS